MHHYSDEGRRLSGDRLLESGQWVDLGFYQVNPLEYDLAFRDL